MRRGFMIFPSIEDVDSRMPYTRYWRPTGREALTAADLRILSVLKLREWTCLPTGHGGGGNQASKPSFSELLVNGELAHGTRLFCVAFDDSETGGRCFIPW